MTFSISSLSFEPGSKNFSPDNDIVCKIQHRFVVPDFFSTCKYPTEAIPPDVAVVSEAAELSALLRSFLWDIAGYVGF